MQDQEKKRKRMKVSKTRDNGTEDAHTPLEVDTSAKNGLCKRRTNMTERQKSIKIAASKIKTRIPAEILTERRQCGAIRRRTRNDGNIATR